MIRNHIILWITLLIIVSSFFVLFFGGVFYVHGMNAKKGRFEHTQEV